jgi:hypothetical protein
MHLWKIFKKAHRSPALHADAAAPRHCLYRIQRLCTIFTSYIPVSFLSIYCFLSRGLLAFFLLASFQRGVGGVGTNRGILGNISFTLKAGGMARLCFAFLFVLLGIFV